MTGSGKTVAGSWFLSQRDFDKRPWYIVNTKGDKLLNAIPGIKEIRVGEVMKKPGLYMIRPVPDNDDDAVNAWLWEIYKRGKSGLYFDEGYNIPQPSKPMTAILTQGRSLEIPCIILSQRPVWLNRFVWSEADFIQCFRLQLEDDEKTMEKLLRVKLANLPDYHSYYRDGVARKTYELEPVPDEDTILQTFEDRRVDRPRMLFI